MDNETKIQEELKKNIPADAGFQAGDASYPEAEPGDAGTNSLPLENYVLKQEVAEFLGLPRGFKNNPDMVGQLDTVLEWAQDMAGTHEISDILHVIGRRQGEMGLKGKPDKLARLYQYVKINKQIDGMYERQRALYG